MPRNAIHCIYSPRKLIASIVDVILVLSCYSEYFAINDLSDIDHSRNSSLVSIYEICVIVRRDRENNRKIEIRISFDNKLILYIIDMLNKEVDYLFDFRVYSLYLIVGLLL